MASRLFCLENIQQSQFCNCNSRTSQLGLTTDFSHFPWNFGNSSIIPNIHNMIRQATRLEIDWTCRSRMWGMGVSWGEWFSQSQPRPKFGESFMRMVLNQRLRISASMCKSLTPMLNNSLYLKALDRSHFQKFLTRIWPQTWHRIQILDRIKIYSRIYRSRIFSQILNFNNPRMKAWAWLEFTVELKLSVHMLSWDYKLIQSWCFGSPRAVYIHLP